MLHADLILHNGHLITLNDSHPRASAMAVRDGRIVAIGGDAEILHLATPQSERINLAGQTVTPGFCDSHIHFLTHGLQLLQEADLAGSADIDEILSRLSTIADRTTGWIQGHGFDQDKLRERRFPTRGDLDRLSRDRPILVSRICGHAVIVNSAASRWPAILSVGPVMRSLASTPKMMPRRSIVSCPSRMRRKWTRGVTCM